MIGPIAAGQASANEATISRVDDMPISSALRQALLRSPASSGASLQVVAVIPPAKVDYLRKMAVEPLIQKASEVARIAAAAIFPSGAFSIRAEPNPGGEGLSDHYVIVTIPTPTSGGAFADAERRFYERLRPYQHEAAATRVSIILDFA